MQCLLLVVCAVGFAMMSAWPEDTPAQGAAVRVDESQDVPAIAQEQRKQEQQEEIPAVTIEQEHTSAPEPAQPELLKADLKLPLAERVESLLGTTSLYYDGGVHYADLAIGPTLWKNERVLVRFDCLAYIFFEALRATYPKISTATLAATSTSVKEGKLHMDLNVNIAITSKALALFLGGSAKTVTVHVVASRVGDAIGVDEVTVEGDKKINDSTLNLGADFLFGTSDYLGVIDDLARKVSASLGAIEEVSEVRYGIIYTTRTR